MRIKAIREFPRCCEFYLQDPYQVITVKTGEKFPEASSRGRRKGAIFKSARALHLSCKACPREKVFDQSPDY